MRAVLAPGASLIHVGLRILHHRLVNHGVGPGHTRCARESLKGEWVFSPGFRETAKLEVKLESRGDFHQSGQDAF